MWGHLIRLVTPLAWDVVRERLFQDKRAPAPPPALHHADMEPRLVKLEMRVDTLGEASARQVEELTRVLRVLGLRATVALWLGIAGVITSVVTLIVVLVRS